jgi:hypothetical protein
VSKAQAALGELATVLHYLTDGVGEPGRITTTLAAEGDEAKGP